MNFLNIFVNSIHAIKDEGDIFIKTFLEGDSVHIEIRDSGDGISQKNLNKIFEPGKPGGGSYEYFMRPYPHREEGMHAILPFKLPFLKLVGSRVLPHHKHGRGSSYQTS